MISFFTKFEGTVIVIWTKAFNFYKLKEEKKKGKTLTPTLVMILLGA